MDRLLLICCAIGLAASQDMNCGWPGKPWNGIVKRQSSGDNPTAIPLDLKPDDVFPAGTIVQYACLPDRFDLLRGNTERMCQPDGRWSGQRPWCDVNVAFGKPVSYSGMTETTTAALTDGLSDSNDPVKTAECPVLAKTVPLPFFEIDLLDYYPVHFVAIYGKDGTIGNMVAKSVELDAVTCVERKTNKTSLLYECARESAEIDARATVGKTVRFEHSDAFSVAVCEVVVYTNPSLSDCGEPEVPANGVVTITNYTQYQEATYQCNVGYDISGVNVRQCHGRKWNGYQPLCLVGSMSSSTESASSTVDPNIPPSSSSASTAQIILIVFCVLFGVGFFVVVGLLLCKKLNCCRRSSPPQPEEEGKKKKRLSWKTTEYREISPTVSQPTVSMTIPVAPKVEEQHIQAESAVEPGQSIYANLVTNDEFQRGSVNNSTHSSVNTSPIYAQMKAVRQENNEPVADPTAVTVAQRVDGSFDGSVAGSESSSRKSYIPHQYRKTSPEHMRQQQLLNDHLKDFLKKEKPVAQETDF